MNIYKISFSDLYSIVTSNMDIQSEKNVKVGYNLNLLVPKKPKSNAGSDTGCLIMIE